jgi:hypothetical protein
MADFFKVLTDIGDDVKRNLDKTVREIGKTTDKILAPQQPQQKPLLTAPITPNSQPVIPYKEPNERQAVIPGNQTQTPVIPQKKANPEYLNFILDINDSLSDDLDDFDIKYKELINFFTLFKTDDEWNIEDNKQIYKDYLNDNILKKKFIEIINKYKINITSEIILNFDDKFDNNETLKIKFLKKLLNIIIIFNILDKKTKFEEINNYIQQLFITFDETITITKTNIKLNKNKVNKDIFLSFFKYYILNVIFQNSELKTNFIEIINTYKKHKNIKLGLIDESSNKQSAKSETIVQTDTTLATTPVAATATLGFTQASQPPQPHMLIGRAGGGIMDKATKTIKYTIFSEIKEFDNKLSSLYAITEEFYNNLQIYKESIKTETDDNNKKIIEFAKTYFNYSQEDILSFFESYFENLKEELLGLINANEDLYLKIQNKELTDKLKKYINKSLYKKSFIFLKNQDINEIQTYSAEKKESYKKILLKYDKLYNKNKGDWIDDINNDQIIEKDLEFKNQIIFYKDAYLKLMELLNGNAINDDYPDLKTLVDNINRISKKISNGEKVSEKDLTDLKEFKLKLKEIENSKPKGQDPEFDKKIAVASKSYEKMQKNEFSQEKIEKLFADNKITKDNELYFDNYVSVFKYALRGLSLIGVALLLGIVVLSLISLFLLIYYLILNLISMFINTNSTKNTSLDFIYKNIIKCTKENYSYDIFNVLYEQSYSLGLFQLGIYAVYILLIYFLLYVFLVIYSSVMSYKFIGSLNEIDTNFRVLTMIAIYVIYGFGHFMIYKLLFKKCAFIPYNDIQTQEKELDELISKYIIISNSNTDTNPNTNSDSNILIDDEFFEALYDSSRVDEINTLFYNGIISDNKDNCFIQKILIYNLYKYLREYIVFDNDIKELFKEYCTSYPDQKPLYKNSNNNEVPVTFISLLNNHEVKLIKKYHEDLPFYNNIPDDKLETFNKLNLIISEKIKHINVKIVNYKGTTSPFLFTILYILIILFYNIVFFYIIILIVVSDTKNEDFPSIITDGLLSIKINIFNPILDYFM